MKWIPLGQIGSFVRGGIIQKTDFVEEGKGCIHYGQIYTRYGTFANQTLTRIPEEMWDRCNKAKKGDLVMTLTSENVEDVCKSVAWLGSEEIGVSGHAAIFTHDQNVKYIAYCTQTDNFLQQKRKFAHGTKVIEISPDQVSKIIIPLPSREEQDRIVAILDKFEALNNSLTEGLPAEIKARQQQYEYYRDKLLTFKRKEVA